MLVSRPIAGRVIRLPDFLIVGAAKAGTTSLFRYLAQHPRVCAPAIKEPHFLSLPHHRELAGRGLTGIGPYVDALDDYAPLFAGATAQRLAGEASVSYLPLWRTVIGQIESLYAEPQRLRIVIMLRDPVDRAFSHHSMKVRDGVESLGFADATREAVIAERLASGYDLTWDYVGLGRYAEAVAAYLGAFPRTLVLRYDAFAADPLTVTGRVLGHLGIDDGFVPDTTLRHNQSGVPRGALARVLATAVFRDGAVKRAGAALVPRPIKSFVRRQAEVHLLTRGVLDEPTAQRLRAHYAADQAALAHLLAGPAA